MSESLRGFGVAAGLDPEIAAPLAGICESAGYTSLWSNDTPIASGLETLAAFAEGSIAPELGVAVLAIDRHSPSEIAARIDSLGLERARLWIGIGAGFSEQPLSAIRAALPELRSELAGIRLALAAMGPKMCALAGAEFDGVFFNWMTPRFAAAARRQVEAGATAGARRVPRVFGYVRTAVGPDAAERLAKEESFYRNLHEGYRNHFARLDEPEGTVGIAVADRDGANAAIARYDTLDAVVVRGLASANLDAMETLAEAAGP